MNNLSLSHSALHILNSYKHLPIGTHKILCPYFNNKSAGLRSALPVLVGKGSPKEIVEEVEIISLKRGLNLNELDEKKIRHLLVDQKIGIDCSGFLYHILNEEFKAKKLGSLRKYLNFQGGPMRRLLARLHPVKNTNVTLLADERNSISIKMKDIQPGDFFVIIGSGKEDDREHTILTTKIDLEDNNLLKIHYAHSLKWNSDTIYSHGVRVGVIDIVKPDENILNQIWTENNKTGVDNETYIKAKSAKSLDIRRIRI